LRSLLPPKRINRRPPLQHRQANSTIKRRAVTRQAPTLPLPPPQKQQRRFPTVPADQCRRRRPGDHVQRNRNERSTGRRKVCSGTGSIEPRCHFDGRFRILRTEPTSHGEPLDNEHNDGSSAAFPGNLWIASPIFCGRPSTTGGEMRVRLEPPALGRVAGGRLPLEAAVSRPGWKFQTASARTNVASTIFPCCTPRSHRPERRSARIDVVLAPQPKDELGIRPPTVIRRSASKPLPKGILKADRRINRMGKSRIRRPRSISSIIEVWSRHKGRTSQLPGLLSLSPNYVKCAARLFSGVRRADLLDYVEVEWVFVQTFGR